MTVRTIAQILLYLYLINLSNMSDMPSVSLSFRVQKASVVFKAAIYLLCSFNITSPSLACSLKNFHHFER